MLHIGYKIGIPFKINNFKVWRLIRASVVRLASRFESSESLIQEHCLSRVYINEREREYIYINNSLCFHSRDIKCWLMQQKFNLFTKDSNTNNPGFPFIYQWIIKTVKNKVICRKKYLTFQSSTHNIYYRYLTGFKSEL